MAKNFSLYEEVAPTGLTANPYPGGSLTASTTYYYRVVFNAANVNGYYFSNTTLSIPSVEATVTTDATNKAVQLYWDNNNTLVYATCHFAVYRTQTSGDYNQTNATGTFQKHLVPVTGATVAMAWQIPTDNANCFAVYNFTSSAVTTLVPGETITETASGATAVVVSNPAAGTTFKVRSITGTWAGGSTFDGSTTGAGLGTWSATSAQVGYSVIDTKADSSCYSMPLYEDGMPTLYVNGGTSSDPITAHDIRDYLVSVSKTYCLTEVPVYPTGTAVNSSGNDLCKYYQWRFHLLNTANTETYFRISMETMVQHVVGKFFFDLSAHVDFGRIDANGLTQGGGIYVGDSVYAFYSGLGHTSGSGGEANLYASYVGGGQFEFTNSSLVNRDTGFQFGGTLPFKMYDSIWLSMGRQQSIYDLKRSRYMSRSVEMTAPGGTCDKVVMDTEVRNIYNIAESYYSNIILLINNSAYNGVYDAFLNNSSEQNILMLHHWINPTWTRASPQFRAVADSRGIPADCLIMEENDLNMTVVDRLGNAIPGVTVEAKDKNGNTAIFTKGTAQTSNKLQKASTSLTTVNGTATIGEVYRIGIETVSVDSGTNPYTITRSVNGLNHNIGGTDTSKRTYLYLQEDSKDTDASGELSLRLLNRYWITYDIPASNTDLTGPTTCGPFTVTFSKPGYQTKIIPIPVTKKIDQIVVLEKSVPLILVDGEKIVLNLSPTKAVNPDSWLEVE